MHGGWFTTALCMSSNFAVNRAGFVRSIPRTFTCKINSNFQANRRRTLAVGHVNNSHKSLDGLAIFGDIRETTSYLFVCCVLFHLEARAASTKVLASEPCIEFGNGSKFRLKYARCVVSPCMRYHWLEYATRSRWCTARAMLQHALLEAVEDYKVCARSFQC